MNRTMHVVPTRIILAVLLLLGLLILKSPLDVQAAVAAPSTPQVTGSATGRTITLTWPKVSNVDGYQVLLYDESARRFRWNKTLTSKASKLTYTYVGQENKTYRFRVNAYRLTNTGRVFSSADTIYVNTIPAPATKVSTLKLSSDKTSCTITWNKNSYAHGYKIYRAVRGGSWQMIKDITSGSTTSYSDKTIKAGTQYYYCVRAYRKNVGSIVMGSYANKMLVTTESSGTTTTTAALDTIFVGDSRFLYMEHDLASTVKNAKWIAKSGAGLQWLQNTASSQVLAAAGKNTKVIFWLGVNDPDYYNNYVKYYNSLITSLKAKGATVYVLTAGQVQNDPYVTNADLCRLNNALKAGVKGATIVDVYSYLKQHGYRTLDGVHYETATTKKIFNYLVSQIGFALN